MAELDVDLTRLIYPALFHSKGSYLLPKSWCSKNKSNLLTLSEDNLAVSYKTTANTNNTNRDSDESGAVRANAPIPCVCGVYYFEVTIVDKGRQGHIGIGLAFKNADLKKLPGWEAASYGYHGDDGHIFHESGNGSKYGPVYTQDDVVGCGVDFINGRIFFTKNGIFLGNAFEAQLTGRDIYPYVGLKSSNEKVKVNMGQEPFKFPFDKHIRKIRDEYMQTILTLHCQDELAHVQMQKLVASYLVHYGYVQTSAAFSRWSGRNIEEDLESIQVRNEIQSLILQGHYDCAVSKIEACYPTVFTHKPELKFQLKCRQFIDMVNLFFTNSSSNHADSSLVIKCNSMLINTSDNFISNGDCPIMSDTTNGFHSNASTNASSRDGGDCESGVPLPVNDVDMEEITPSNGRPPVLNGHDSPFDSPSPSSPHSYIPMVGDRPPDNSLSTEDLRSLIDFGRSLNQMAAELRGNNKFNGDSSKLLKDAFSLLAYTNPSISPLGDLLSTKHREQTANVINSEILDAQSLPKRPGVECAVQYLDQWLSNSINGLESSPAFIHPRMLLHQ